MKSQKNSGQLEAKLEAYLQLSKSISVKPLTDAKTFLPIGAAMFGALSSMDAAIVYSGIQNVAINIPVNFNQGSININGAGGNDFEIQNNLVAGVAFIQANEIGAADFALNGFIGNVVGNYGYPNANAAGFVIGAGGPWANGVGDANTLADNAANEAQYPNTKWETDGMTAFIGFRGVLGGGTKYGWIRLTRNTHTNWTIVDWAYESTNNTSIVAGATASLSADLALVLTSNTTTPATGQTVTFTLVVSNSGPNAATNVEIKNIVPSGLTFVPGSMTGPGIYVSGSPGGTGLRWQNIFIANGGSVVLTFQATVTAASGNIVNFSEVQASAEVDPDSTPGNGQ